MVAALALPAVPAAAQGKALGKPAGVGKPTTTVVKGTSTPVTKGKSADAKSGTRVKGNSADHPKGSKTTTTNTETTTGTETTASSDSKGRGQLPLGEKIALNNTLKARLDHLLVGSTLTFDQATTGWKNQGQLVAAMNAARNNNLAFPLLYTEMVTNGKKLPDAVVAVKALAPTPTPTTTTTPAPTTP
jgi:hypothetical protein